MKNIDYDEIMYFKDILTDHLASHPELHLTTEQILIRSTYAAFEMNRDDLSTTQVLDNALRRLLDDDDHRIMRNVS